MGAGRVVPRLRALLRLWAWRPPWPAVPSAGPLPDTRSLWRALHRAGAIRAVWYGLLRWARTGLLAHSRDPQGAPGEAPAPMRAGCPARRRGGFSRASGTLLPALGHRLRQRLLGPRFLARVLPPRMQLPSPASLFGR